MSDRALVVDLDGSLISTDTLYESLMGLLKANVFLILLLPFWLLKGKAHLKNNIAQRVTIDVATLPYNQAVINYIKAAKEQGRKCYLATGSVKKYADNVAKYVGLFDEVFSTDDQKNLTGSHKAHYLNQRFGKGGYDYLGNHSVDLKLWRHSHTAIVVSNSARLIAQAEKVCRHVEVLAAPKATFKTYLKGIRVHQWVKNALIFVPLFSAHKMQDMDAVVMCLLGFLAYSLAASSVYVLNDLLDLDADRVHATKKNRPFASGHISILAGLILFSWLLFFSFSVALVYTPIEFTYALIMYYALTLAYSFKLKRVLMLDTILLAALYTMRIIAGTLLIAVSFSFWLLAFSMFIFLSLALLKRYTELVLMKAEGKTTSIGRGYRTDDASMIAGLGNASGYISVLVMALYVNSPAVTNMYSVPEWLWLICPVLLYWISRAWLLAHRGQMNDDPIVFAVKDKVSLLMGLVTLTIFLVAR